jgi:hypothetical protein
MFLAQNHHIRMGDIVRHGYVTVDVTADTLQADWWYLDTIARRDRSERWGGGWRLLDGQVGLVEADAPADADA